MGAPRDLFADSSAQPRNLFPEDTDNAAIKKQQADKLAYYVGANRTPVDTIRDLVGGALTGAAQGGQAVSQLLPGAPNMNMEDYLSGISSPNKSMGGDLAKSIGSYLPYGMTGGARFVSQIAPAIAHGFMTTQPGEENSLLGISLPSGRIGGALKDSLMNTLTLGAGKALNALRPSNLFRGNLSPEELERNIRITQGTETGLGDVIGSPYLKRQFENTLPALPLSGAHQAMQRTGNIVQQRGVDLMQEMLGDADPHGVPKAIADELENQYQIRRGEKNALYADFNQKADQSGTNLELPTFAKKANDYSDAIESTNMLKMEPDTQKIFNKLQNYKNPVQETRIQGQLVDEKGNPLIDTTESKYPTFQEANILKGKLNDFAEKAKNSPDPAQRYAEGLFRDLASSIKTDIRSSIKDNPEISASYEGAEENYKRNFSPFLDRDIYKFVRGKSDPETIVNKFVKTTPNSDLANQLEKLSSKLPEEKKNLLGYAYFSRALDNEGHINPLKMATAVRKLGHNQFESLVPNADLRQRLMDYGRLAHMNTESQNLMFNPKTGARGTDALVAGLTGALAHGIKGNASFPAKVIGALGTANIARRALTNQSLREGLVRKMLENEGRMQNPWSNQ